MSKENLGIETYTPKYDRLKCRHTLHYKYVDPRGRTFTYVGDSLDECREAKKRWEAKLVPPNVAPAPVVAAAKTKPEEDVLEEELLEEKPGLDDDEDEDEEDDEDLDDEDEETEE